MIPTTRRKIVEILNHRRTTDNLYTELMCCIKAKNDIDMKLVQDWFEGAISAIFYRPTNVGLVLVGNQGVGKSYFLRHLFPNIELYSDTANHYSTHPNIYHNLIVDMTDYGMNEFKKLVASDGFTITPDCRVEKRLASLAYTTQTMVPGLDRKSLAVIHIEKIDWIWFNSIDKNLLWIEIYNKFLEKHGIYKPFDKQDIKEFFS